MAAYFLRARHISRGKGGRVTRAAAYRAGKRILDQRTSRDPRALATTFKQVFRRLTTTTIPHCKESL
jgi:hypothetical protein